MDAFKMDVFILGCIITGFMMGIGLQTVSGNVYSRDSALLHNVLLSGYQSEVIPMKSHYEPVVLKIYPTIVKLANRNSMSDVLEATFSITMTWQDDRLQWDPSEFGNISELYTPMKHLWRPDVRVHELGQGNKVHLFDDLDLAVVTNIGSVTYPRITNVRFLCSTDYLDFPYDESKCYVTIGSWLYTARHIQMEFWHTKESKVNINFQTDNPGSDISATGTGQWKLIGNRAQGVVKNVTHACCPDDPNMLFEITLDLRRDPGWMAIVLFLSVIVPAVLVPLQFCLSPKADNRLIQGVVGLIMASSSAAYLTVFLPIEQANISKIGVSILGNVCLSTLALVATIIVTAISQHDDQPPPDWLYRFMTSIQPLVCVNSRRQFKGDHHQSSQMDRHSRCTSRGNRQETIPLHEGIVYNGSSRSETIPLQEGIVNNGSSRLETIPLSDGTDVPMTYHNLGKDFAETPNYADGTTRLYDSLRSFVEQLKNVLEVFNKQPHGDWKVIVTIIDRVFLFGFTVMSMIFIIIALSCL